MKKEFSPFLVVDLFTVKKGTQKNMNSLESGSTPLISAKKIDNGFKDFVKTEPKEVFKGHCITLNNDGDGGAGLAFYQPSDYALDTHVTALYPKENLSRYQLLYISNCISKQRVLFGHGHSINSSRIAHLTCMLPVDEMGNPDYQYMEHYMKNLEMKMLKRYQEYLLATKRNKLKDSDLGGRFHTCRYKDFVVEDLFVVKRPCARKEDDYEYGDVCFVASGGANNGVTKYCKPKYKENMDKGNCITVSPVDGSCYYQPSDFLGRGGAGSSILLLYPKDFTMEKYTGLFIVQAIYNTTKSKYSYGHMASIDRIKKDRILLPVNCDNKPDYEYMESYMKSQETRIINRYITNRLNNA